MKILGIHFNNDLQETSKYNWNECLLEIEKHIKNLSRRHVYLRRKGKLLNTMTISKVTFLSNVFPIPKQIQGQLDKYIFQNIWQFFKKEPIARKTLYLSKNQGGIGLIQTEHHSMTMRIKHFLKLKEETNQETWITLTRYNLASILYQLHKDFKYMISNKLIKTDRPKIQFYYEDIINYVKKQTHILNLQNNSKIIYKQIIQNQYNLYTLTGQAFWNQYLTQIQWDPIWKNTFYSYNWPENNNILYYLLHYATKTNDQIYRWTNQKHLKTPKCKLCEKTENINHLFIHCKRNKKIWNHFQKYYTKLTKKEYTPLQHILTQSTISLPPNTKN